MATPRTQFRRRKVPIQSLIDSTVPVRLIFQFSEYFPERRIRYVFGQIVVLNHSGHVQSFDIDRLVLADDLCREFLKHVPAGITDFGVQFGHFKFRIFAVIAPISFAREAPLKSLQALFAPDEWARVFEFLPVAGRDQGLNPDIDADLGFGLLKRLNLGVDKDTDKIAFARISADGEVYEFRVVGKLSAPDDVERFRLLGESDQAIFKGEGVRGVTG